jgi:CRP/FNR family transcriptional regulator, cyclic AMP receptor protein
MIEHAFGCGTRLTEVIATRATYRAYLPREAMVASDAIIRNAFLMIEGQAREFATALDGRQLLVQEFVPGDLFGEGAILGEHMATEEVLAITRVDAGLFSASDLVNLIENYSCVAIAFSRLLTQRLRQTRRRMVEGVTLSAAGRIHAELLRQGRGSASWTIAPAPVLAEFAMTVQSTRETVSRTISQLERRGIIRRADGMLTIVAPHRLEDLIY